MTDERFSDLFAQGTAPERDPGFARKVAAGIGRERLRIRLGALALRATVVLTLSGAAFLAAGVIEPVLAPLLDGASQFMGVPAPMVLGVLIAGLALFAGRHVLFSDASRRFLPAVLDDIDPLAGR